MKPSIEVMNKFGQALGFARANKIEVYIGTSVSSDILLNDVTISIKKKFQVTEMVDSEKDGLKDVIVLADKDFKGEFYKETVKDFKDDMRGGFSELND